MIIACTIEILRSFMIALIEMSHEKSYARKMRKKTYTNMLARVVLK